MDQSGPPISFRKWQRATPTPPPSTTGSDDGAAIDPVAVQAASAAGPGAAGAASQAAQVPAGVDSSHTLANIVSSLKRAPEGEGIAESNRRAVAQAAQALPPSRSVAGEWNQIIADLKYIGTVIDAALNGKPRPTDSI